MIIKPITREEMHERWASKAPPIPTDDRPLPRARNLSSVLDMGETIYILFRGRPYGVPSPPYKMGEAVLDAYLRVRACPEVITRETLPMYREAMHDLAKLLRRCLRPGGSIIRKLMFHLRLWNPMDEASEGDIVQLALFTLGRRMKSRGVAVVGDRPTPRI